MAASILLVSVAVIYCLGIIGVIAFARWQRKSRWPFKEEDKLLRGPGEELRRRIAKLDEGFASEFVGGGIGILAAMALVGDLLRRLFGWSPTTAGWLAVLAGVIVMSVSLWRIRRLWQERARCYLGWFGERLVGEQLQLATVHGWRVFHDLPFKNNGAGFNIDHAVVGPGGVFVIETKTRRKGGARPGFDDNKVYFDGRDLVWPWGEDNHGLEQAERSALWLTNWIRTEIGERVHVSPILALPGWWLEMKPARESRLCRVVNPKWLPSLLRKQPALLSPKQIELIALRLEARCRDVED
jgi:hypothetical protein